jgi:exodeoxyribonuclease VII small subunit
MAKKNTTEQITFEDALKELENIAEKLSMGDLHLDESIILFERGMELKKICTASLNRATKQIKILMKDDEDGFTENNFEVEENE